MAKANRRDFIKSIGVGATLSATQGLRATSASRAAEGDQRPNILVIMVDDLGKEWIGCCGADDIETPNVDALAAGGMRFEKPYDRALDKACTYVNGNANVHGTICTGLDGEITHNPSYLPHQHGLGIFDSGGGQCCCHAANMETLVESVDSVDAAVVYIWGGCGSDTACYYAPYWGSFRVLKPAHDLAGANPHFAFHAETLVSGTYYDPSYGGTGLITLAETAPAHPPYSAASQRTGSGFPPSTEHDLNPSFWTCPH